MNEEQIQVAVIISADAEWAVVCRQFVNCEIHDSPLGQYFLIELPVEAGVEPLLIFHGGWGKIAAAASAQYVIDRWKPGCIINLGTCGGFRGAIEKGDLVLATRTLVYDVVELMGNQDDAIAHYTTTLDLSWLVDPLPGPVIKALMVSADRDIHPGDIEKLVAQYGAIAADWESGAIAFVASRNKVRCLILRAVSDLVSADGGEAYGQLAVFHEGASCVMSSLLKALPGWVAVARREFL